MKVYALRNSNGEYVSMSGDRTKDWFQASKFPVEQSEERLKYTADEFKLVEFDVNEIIEVK